MRKHSPIVDIACRSMGFWTGNRVAERRRLSPRLLGYSSVNDRNLWVNLW
ncbi:MAG: hypothetical protein HWQ38_00800 [Nostoc sp. NMS7]|nr:hypothetical protein [Nostoc sp. NMS7]MBN3945097.1 hypothetical protein [Nostoc sp. NMS7]